MLLTALPLHAETADSFIRMPGEMIDSGFAQHVLPRFKFRHQVQLTATAKNEEAELELRPEGDLGEPILIDGNGVVYRLVIQTGSKAGPTFAQWLRSENGQRTVEGFPRGGPPLYRVYSKPAEASDRSVFEGDTRLGADLALLHCGRCHVVDDRNRMGGIGSAPSFGALRARSNWEELFEVFWIEPPHPSFTLIPGMTEEFTASRPSRISPVKLSLEEVEAIIAFIATIPPKDLGAPISFN